MPLVGSETVPTFATLQQRVRLNCNNLPTQHPHYALIPTYVNEAKDELMTLMLTASGKRFLDLAPKLLNWRWWDKTVVGQPYLPLPSDMLDLEAVTITKSPDDFVLGSSTEYVVRNERDPETFGYFPKAQTGWPSFYRRAAGSVELWPTSTSAYVTAIVLRGTKKEDDLVNPGDKYVMEAKLQNFVVDLATAIAMEKMGWEEAPARRASIESRLSKVMNLRAEESLAGITSTTVKGMPL